MKNPNIIIILVVALCIFAVLATKNIGKSRVAAFETACIESLADIEGAKDQYAIEHEGQWMVSKEQLIPDYLDEFPTCPSDGTYTLGDLQVLVSCTVDGHILSW